MRYSCLPFAEEFLPLKLYSMEMSRSRGLLLLGEHVSWPAAISCVSSSSVESSSSLYAFRRRSGCMHLTVYMKSQVLQVAVQKAL